MARPSFRKKADDSGNIVKYTKEKFSVGDVRKTQLISTYGIGSIVDFKNDTVIIASADNWDYNPNNYNEIDERKIFNENLSAITGAEYFLMPRITKSTNSFSQEKNVESYIFPEKLHCSKCGYIFDFKELSVNKRHQCPNCGGNLNASRFVVACANGHLDDFPYDWWVHRGKPCSSGKSSPRIRMNNIYNRTDMDSLRLECIECKEKRSMINIFNESSLSEFHCTCKHPHFKDPMAQSSFGCKEKMSARLRTASGVYFPITKSALLIPPWSKKIVGVMQKHYEILKNVSQNKLAETIRNYIHDDTISDEEIIRSWTVVENALFQRSKRNELSIFKDEYEILSNEQNTKTGNFSSYSAIVPNKYRNIFDQIAVVDRLTITQAFLGFTRITRNESNKVPITQYRKTWLPAVELSGEGIFIRFNKESLSKWRANNSTRYKRMENAMNESRFISDSFSEIYVMLHTFSHLFIREISNICGYNAASIKEKIYSHINDENNKIEMCGVLIYVSSTDNDCSLGGLISIADNEDLFESIIDNMIDSASWCSGDPLCISSTKQGYKNLNYAACHDCVLLPETSCEKYNCFLDRASIVGLPDNPNLGFFINNVNRE